VLKGDLVIEPRLPACAFIGLGGVGIVAEKDLWPELSNARYYSSVAFAVNAY